MEHLVLAGFTNKESITSLTAVTIKMPASCFPVDWSVLLKTELGQQTIPMHGKTF